MFMQEKVSSFIKGSFGLAGAAGLIVLVVCFMPFVFIWSLNTMAELGGISFYIEHGVFSYFVAFVVVAVLRG